MGHRAFGHGIRFLPAPVQHLFWDKVIREGRTEAVFAAIRQAGQTLLQYDNVKFYGYLMDPEIVTNLDNYCDYIHHSGGVCREILAMLQREEGRLTEENLEETLANWREFVVHYDYDQFWDERFGFSGTQNVPRPHKAAAREEPRRQETPRRQSRPAANAASAPLRLTTP
ncbi:MAG: hypothetical protein ACLTG0_09065 [Oscillibacter sp.]